MILLRSANAVLLWSAHHTGTFLDLGASHQFQFVSSKLCSETSTHKRVLPPTPGQPTNGKPPSKPPRQHVAKTNGREATDGVGGAEISSSYTGSIDLDKSSIDEGLRSRLKRIAKEIASRSSGYHDRKPPPVHCLYAASDLALAFKSCIVTLLCSLGSHLFSS